MAGEGLVEADRIESGLGKRVRRFFSNFCGFWLFPLDVVITQKFCAKLGEDFGRRIGTKFNSPGHCQKAGEGLLAIAVHLSVPCS